mgnify:CR=1 FL=1
MVGIHNKKRTDIRTFVFLCCIHRRVIPSDAAGKMGADKEETHISEWIAGLSTSFAHFHSLVVKIVRMWKTDFRADEKIPFVLWDFQRVAVLSTIPPKKVENRKRDIMMAQFSSI